MDPKEKTPEELATNTPAAVTPESTPAPTDTPAVTPAEDHTEPAAPRHKFADRMEKAFPGREFASDDDYESAMNEHLDGLESYKEKGQLANQKLIALFDAEPQVGEIVRDMLAGATFREALARHVSPEDLTAVEGDPDYEGWNKNKTDRESRMAQNAEREAEINKNLELSQAEIESFAQENNLDPEGVQVFLEKIDNIISDVKQGKVSKQTLSHMKKAFDYDNDLASAAETAKIAGRNENIVAGKETAADKSDGLPRVTGSSEVKEEPVQQPDYMSGLIDKVGKRKYV